MSDDSLSDYELKLLANVQKLGYQITSVFGTADEPDFVPFGYSIGFELSFAQPEVIVFGFGADLIASVIRGIANECGDGAELSDWAEFGRLLEGHRCILRKIETANITREHFNSAMWFAERSTGQPLARAMQVVWPDARNGLFPWEDGCAEEVRRLQPPLYRTSLNS